MPGWDTLQWSYTYIAPYLPIQGETQGSIVGLFYPIIHPLVNAGALVHSIWLLLPLLPSLPEKSSGPKAQKPKSENETSHPIPKRFSPRLKAQVDRGGLDQEVSQEGRGPAKHQHVHISAPLCDTDVVGRLVGSAASVSGELGCVGFRGKGSNRVKASC